VALVVSLLTASFFTVEAGAGEVGDGEACGIDACDGPSGAGVTADFSAVKALGCRCRGGAADGSLLGRTTTRVPTWTLL